MLLGALYPYHWQPTPTELKRLEWVILAIFNDNRFKDVQHFVDVRSEYEEWARDNDFHAEAAICRYVIPAVDPDGRVSYGLPPETYILFRNVEDAILFKLRWL